MYKIEIWRFHLIHETYTSNNIKEILKWYRENYLLLYEYGECCFYVYKNDEELSFDECSKIGFFVSFEELEEEEE